MSVQIVCRPTLLWLLLICVPFGSCEEWEGFLGKFTSRFFGNDGFFDLPLVKGDAQKMDPPYENTHVQDPDFQLEIHCLRNDPHVCLLFDKKGVIAGLRISHFKSEVANNLTMFPYKYDEIPMFKSTKLLGYDAWYTNFLFTDPNNLLPTGRGRASHDETAEGIWVLLKDGWKEIPRDECEAQRQGFKKQGFVRWMGNHYSYGQLDNCATFLPILPIYHKGRLIAMSFAPLGKHITIDRDWFETVPSDVVPDIVPNGYQTCLQKWTEDFGVSSFHFYFINHPRWILFDRSSSC